MHVHIGGRINGHLKIKTCRCLKLKEALQDFLVTLKQGSIRGFQPY